MPSTSRSINRGKTLVLLKKLDFLSFFDITYKVYDPTVREEITMDKKFVISIAAVVLVGGIFVLMSFSPSPSKKDRTKSERPTWKPFGGQKSPPPPPPPASQLNKKPRDPNYQAFQINHKPDSEVVIQKGEVIKLNLDVTPGSEPYDVSWMKETETGQYNKVFDGSTFSVVYEDRATIKYEIHVKDTSGRREVIYFDVKNNGGKITKRKERVVPPPPKPPAVNALKDVPAPPPPSMDSETKQDEINTNETKPKSLIASQDLGSTTVDIKSKQTEQAEVVTDKEVIEKPEEKAPQKIASAETVQITATKNTQIIQKKGTPVKMSYTVSGLKNYQIFWFHKPPGRKKGSLIKKKKTLNFSLKKLNKYHAGEFYIQVKDKKGKFHKSESYVIKVK